MPHRRRFNAIILCALGATSAALAACINLGAYACQEAADCNRQPDGMCGPDGFCAYPDDACPSGFSYQGAGSLDGECVSPAGTDTSEESEETTDTAGESESAEGESESETGVDPDMPPESGCGDLIVEPGEFCPDPQPLLLSVGVGPFSVRAFQFDDDGELDLVVSSQTADQLEVFFGNGDGTFEDGPLRVLMGDLWELGTGDFTGDGKADVVVCERDGEQVLLFAQGDVGTLLDPVGFPVTKPASLSVGDIDGDGNLDVVTSIDADVGGITVILGDGSGGFSRTIAFGGGAKTFGVEVLDIDGDDSLDVVATNRLDNSATIYVNNAQQGEDFDMAIEPAFTTGLQPSFPAVADLDDDNDDDIIIANLGSNNASIYDNTVGSFSIAETFQSCTAPGAPEPADVDQDGDLDIIVPCIGGGVVIGFNDGDGLIDDTLELATEGLPASAATGDFNGDGALDFVTTSLLVGASLEVFVQEP